MSRSKFRLIGLFGALALGLAAQSAQAGEAIRLEADQAHVLRLARPADTVVIGNPAIADAVVQDARTIVLTGKDFGVTNIVVMDKGGAPILDSQVIVARTGPGTTQIYRQGNVQTLSCTPYCVTMKAPDGK